MLVWVGGGGNILGQCDICVWGWGEGATHWDSAMLVCDGEGQHTKIK